MLLGVGRKVGSCFWVDRSEWGCILSKSEGFTRSWVALVPPERLQLLVFIIICLLVVLERGDGVVANLCVATSEMMQAFWNISSVAGDHLWSVLLIPPASRTPPVDWTVEKVFCSLWREIEGSNGVA